MSHALLDSIGEHFAELDDPHRETANRRHEFLDILAIALCAVIGGANHWTTVVTFAQAKELWFRRFLRLPNGIPSHDTFSDVFAKIDPDTFEICFVAWVRALAATLPGVPLVAIGCRPRGTESTIGASAERAHIAVGRNDYPLVGHDLDFVHETWGQPNRRSTAHPVLAPAGTKDRLARQRQRDLVAGMGVRGAARPSPSRRDGHLYEALPIGELRRVAECESSLARR